MIFGKPDATMYAGMQSAKGAAAALSGSDAVDFLRESSLIWPKGEQVDRGLNRAGRYPSKKAIIGQWGEGEVMQEVRGSGTAGTPPNGLSPFLETLLGTKLTNAAGTVEIGSGAVDGFDSTLDLSVGQVLRVDVAGDASKMEIRRIATKSGGGPYTYTVQREFSQAPVDSAPIAAGVTYLHLSTETESYMTVEQYIKTVRHKFTDAVCESLALTIAEREIIKGTFGVRALTYAKTTATPDPYTEVFDDTAALGGVDCNLIVGTTATNMKNVDCNLTTRRARGGINSAGFGDLPWNQTFEAGGSLSPWVEDFGAFDDFFAGTLATIEMSKGLVAGNMLHIELADVQYTGPEVGDDEGDFQWNLPFEITGGAYIALF